MSRSLLVLALLLLAACSEKAEPSYTVDQLIADETLLSRITAECRNNPGELRQTANCQNAEAADGKLRLEKMRKALGG
ncbi:EexN family lipoprotein (plasmid) [Agrobacterium leguminum]|uniref:EexN family lipoprotein n=1 Tax=Agrobacterium leguminum TaxID=2792015 RepID=UPI00272BB247|nr:EexN family lipoprotein [Agrobacterium leguminum]WLE00792.1 EexN family lipoprotein [Agrobacterium leguminum]